MAISGFEIPEDWGDPISELRERVKDLPEDEEDRWIRQGQASYEAMSPEDRAIYDQRIRDELDKFQQPGVAEAIDKVFRDRFNKLLK